MPRHFVLAFCCMSSLAFGQLSLTTTYASNNGQSGNMFDLDVTATVLIQSFNVNLDPGTWDVEIYAVSGGGSWVGNEATAAAWTLLASVPSVVSNGTDVPTPLGLSLGFPVTPGGLQGFYVTVTSGAGINYTNGAATGALFATDGVVSFFEGCGKAYPFAATFQPRIFNGDIIYSIGTPMVVDHQINQPGASLDINGVMAFGTSAAQSSAAGGVSATVTWSGAASATVFDIALSLGDATVPNGLTTPTQVFNMNLLAPTFTWGFGGLFSTPFTLVSLPFSLISGTPTLQAQMVILDPTSADGFFLSQPLNHTTF